MRYVNLNGKIVEASQAVVPVDNSAFRYGYGLFETILIQNGEIRLWDYHWDRLTSGFKRIYFDAAFASKEEVMTEVLRTVGENKMEKLCRVRLQVYGTGEGVYYTVNLKLHYLIECFAVEVGIGGLDARGLTAGLAAFINGDSGWQSGVKSCSALKYAMAARQAKENGWDDALLCNEMGYIMESTIANIFWIKDGTIFTVPLRDGCVAGVMRRYVMDRITVTEKSLTTESLLEADEVFLTNAITGIRWVRNIGPATFTNELVKTIYQIVYENE